MRSIVVAVIVAAALTTAGCGGGGTSTDPTVTSPPPKATPTPGPLTITGAVALGPGAVIQDIPEAGQCSAHSQYADIEEGVQVSILDATGAVVAVADLDAGVTADTGCIWWFTATVPAGGKFYSAEVLDWASDKLAEADVATEVIEVLPAN